MKKDLFMHFRINHETDPSQENTRHTFQKGNRVLKVVQTFKRVLGKPGPTSESLCGMTIAGLLMPEGDRIIIKWGFSMVRGENFIKLEGCDRARSYALAHEYITEDMPYDEAKAFAEDLSKEIWHQGTRAMDTTFRDAETKILPR
jgi:hypothetical protein